MTGPNILEPSSSLNSLSSGQARASVISDTRAGQLLHSNSLSPSARMELATYLANKFGVSRSMAYSVVRNIHTGANAPTLSQIKKVFDEAQAKGARTERQAPAADQFAKSGRSVNHEVVDKNLGDVFKYRQERVQEASTNRTQFEQSFAGQVRGASDLPLEKFIPQLNQYVNSPQQFASLLVNNKQTFVLLKSSPQLLSFLLAMANKNFQPSPMLMARIVELVAQVLRLKAGKAVADDEDEQVKHDRVQEDMVAEADHHNNLVDGIKHTIETIPVKSLRDFLLEAERFAEEEIVNMWSLALKKERQLEKSIIDQLKKITQKK